MSRIPSPYLKTLNRVPEAEGGFVLYWMQASQRALGNPALIYAAEQADSLGLPLLAVFGLTADYPEANARHYVFMLQGLRETADTLKKNGIGFVMAAAAPPAAALAFSSGAALIVCDCGYLAYQQAWRREVADKAGKKTVMVESDVLFSAWDISPKEEWSAYTLRRKMLPLRDYVLSLGRDWCEYIPKPVRPLKPADLKRILKTAFPSGSIDIIDPMQDPEKTARALAGKKAGRAAKSFSGIPAVSRFTGGTSAALERLDIFIQEKLSLYAEKRSRPELSIQSDLSPYLHFGHISPVLAAVKVMDADGFGKGPGMAAAASQESFLEELIVRRELAVNFVLYNTDYDDFSCLPDWAKKTLLYHAKDRRPLLYTESELENAATTDPYWNAAMLEMKATGKMHNYMRMYWGKKIIEWSADPREAFRTMIRLNNKYFLDGRDPNSYAGVAWCFGKHDRPWTERAIFGSVRYMNRAGLTRKFDMDGYLQRVAVLTAAEFRPKTPG